MPDRQRKRVPDDRSDVQTDRQTNRHTCERVHKHALIKTGNQIMKSKNPSMRSEKMDHHAHEVLATADSSWQVSVQL